MLVVGLPLVEGERSPTALFRHPTRRYPFTLSPSLALVLFVSFLLEAWGLPKEVLSAGWSVGPCVWARRLLALLLPLLAGSAFGRAASACGLPCCCLLVEVTLGFRGASTRGRLWLKCLRRT